MTTSYCGGVGGVDDNAAQAGYVIAQTVRGGVTHTLTSEGADASEDGTGRGTPIVAQYAPDIARTLTAGTAKTKGVNPPGRRQEDDHNIVVTPLALRGRDDGAELEAREPGSPANSLRTPAGGASQALVAITHTETIVRRLTELECERLQGYPDEYTDDQSGSARYRQLGNSVAVPVVEFIARRMVAIDERNRA